MKTTALDIQKKRRRNAGILRSRESHEICSSVYENSRRRNVKIFKGVLLNTAYNQNTKAPHSVP